MRSRTAPYLAALLAALLVSAAVLYFDRYERRILYQELQTEAFQELSKVKSLLEFAVNSRLMPVEGLSSYISTNPGISRNEFDEFARQIMDRQKGIHSIEIVRGTVITSYIYPFKGNEKAIGLDLMSMPAERKAIQRAITTKKTVVAGPVDLVQGGIAFISRSPIFVASVKGSQQRDKYWGLTQAIITTDTVFAEAGLFDRTAFRLAIRGKDSTGASGEVFFGDKKVFNENPMLLDVTLFSGSWQLAAVPVKGWTATPPYLWILRIGGFILSVLTGILAWILVHHPVILKEKIEQAVKTLKEKEREMQKLKDSIETVERRRIAKELHDGVGQSILAIKLGLQMMKAGKTEANSETIEELITEVSTVTGEIRDIAKELRVPFLEADDIIKAVRLLSARIEEKSGIKIEIITDGNLKTFDYNIRYNIYRICQEALNNIVKHSGADRATIRLAASGGKIFLEIKDPGRGFALDAAREEQRGSGLSTMAERAESLRGSFNIQSVSGQGTVIQITAPLA